MPLTTKQFVWSVLLVTLGCAMWMASDGIVHYLSFFPFLAVMLIEMPRDELASRVGPIDRWAMISIVIIVMVIGLAIWAFRAWEDSIGGVMKHPLLVTIFWALTLAISYTRWKRGRKPADPPDAAAGVTRSHRPPVE